MKLNMNIIYQLIKVQFHFDLLLLTVCNIFRLEEQLIYISSN